MKNFAHQSVPLSVSQPLQWGACGCRTFPIPCTWETGNSASDQPESSSIFHKNELIFQQKLENWPSSQVLFILTVCVIVKLNVDQSSHGSRGTVLLPTSWSVSFHAELAGWPLGMTSPSTRRKDDERAADVCCGLQKYYVYIYIWIPLLPAVWNC